MKNLYTLFISFLFIISVSAQKNIAIADGTWTNNSIWSLNHVPVNGEMVIIPGDITVQVAGNQDYSTTQLDIQVWGTLEMNNGKLALGYQSKITLFDAATIETLKWNSADKINIGGVEKYNGAEGTITGPLVANNLTSVSPNGFMKSAPVVLPVKFAQFSVTTKNNAVQVQWATAEEVNAAYFEVQRSSNGTTWVEVGNVKAAGNTTALTQYNFTDRSMMTGKSFYRIKQADVDGKVVYTSVQSISNNGGKAVSIVTAAHQVAVQFAQPAKGKTEVLMLNAAGQVVIRQVVENGSGVVVLNNTTNLKGAYFVAVNNGAGISASQQIIL